jgi:hypothetical protein
MHTACFFCSSLGSSSSLPSTCSGPVGVPWTAGVRLLIARQLPCTAMMSATGWEALSTTTATILMRWFQSALGWGWTVNFAHPAGRAFLAVMALLIPLPVLLLLLGVQLPPVGCHPAGCFPAR